MTLEEAFICGALPHPLFSPLAQSCTLLLCSGNVRKADVTETAKAEGLEVDESLYNKMVRAYCTSRGALWFLKAGDL